MRYFQEPLYSEVLPNLFISGTLDEDIVQRGNFHDYAEKPAFESVVCMYVYANPMGHGVREQRYGIPDAKLSEDRKPEILELARWLHSEWKAGKRVAGKCQAGLNRSSLIVALVLVEEGFSAAESINLIRAKRSPNALCNDSFVSFIYEVFESKSRSAKKTKLLQ